MRAEAIALTRIGPYEVALRADEIVLVLDASPPEEDAAEIDLAARLGSPPSAGARSLVVRAGRAMRVRVGEELRIVTHSEPALELPAMVAPLLDRLGVVGLLPHGDGFALLFDSSRLGEQPA